MDDNLPAGGKTSSLVDQQPVAKPTQPVADKTTGYQPSPTPSEQKEVVGSLFKEGEPRVIEKKEFEPAPEVKKWVSKVKEAEEITLPKPITDEYGQILIEAAAPVKPRIVLPLTKPKIKKALQKKIVESIRWLAEWCLRLIKMFPKRVSYKQLT